MCWSLKFYRPDPRQLEKLRTVGKIPFVDSIDVRLQITTMTGASCWTWGRYWMTLEMVIRKEAGLTSGSSSGMSHQLQSTGVSGLLHLDSCQRQHPSGLECGACLFVWRGLCMRKQGSGWQTLLQSLEDRRRRKQRDWRSRGKITHYFATPPGPVFCEFLCLRNTD